MQLPKHVTLSRVRPLLFVLGILIIALGIFEAGVAVGYHKAGFSYEWGDHYYRAFGPSRSGRTHLRPPGDDALSDHGAAGLIVSLSLPTFIIEDTNHVERIVRISGDTMIRQSRETLSASSLKEHDFVVVLGRPNARAEIEARFIRLLPTMFGNSPVATSTRKSI